MSEWINVKDSLPDPYEAVWIYWRDSEVVLGCRTYEGKEAILCPANEGWYSFEHEKCRWTYWWQRIYSGNIDKPNPPKEKHE